MRRDSPSLSHTAPLPTSPGTMSATLRLRSPDLPTPLSLAVEPSSTILQVKESILAQWPAGNTPRSLPPHTPRAVRAHCCWHLGICAPADAETFACAGTAQTPTAIAQLRIIHQGKFLTDGSVLKGALSPTAAGGDAWLARMVTLLTRLLRFRQT